MLISQKDLIFNGDTFNADYFHNGDCECPYCFLKFTHHHSKESKLDEFTMINPSKEKTWEDKFDEEFPFGSFAGSSVNAGEVKDFIRREFI